MKQKEFTTRMYGEAIRDALGVSRDEYNDFWETDYYNPKFDRP